MSDKKYEVGYGKPPLHTRFKPGHSGCKTGGNKKPKPLSDQLDRILREKLTVTEGGKSQRMCKEDVFLRQLVNRAISGERQASGAVLAYLIKRQQRPNPAGTSATDAFLISELQRMIETDVGASKNGRV